MAATDPDLSADAAAASGQKPRARRLAVAAGLAALAIGLAWAERIDIANRLIDRQIRVLKLSAAYRVDEIGPGREVLSDIRVGDPAHPDLTIKRLEIGTGWRGGLPAITGLKLVGTRLRGRLASTGFTFGSLDRVLFAPSRGPWRLPAITLALRDAAAHIDGDYGPIGVAISGDGNLRDGFAGAAAIVAPELRIRNCTAAAANFQGRIAVSVEQPRLTGWLRMAQFACPGPALAVQAPRLHLDLRSDATLGGGAAHLVLATGAAKLGSQAGAARLTGGADASLRNGVLESHFTLGSDRLSGMALGAAQLGVTGHLRATPDAGGVWRGDGTLSGRDLVLAPPVVAALARAQAAGGPTMAGALLAALRGGIARETAADRLSGRWIGEYSPRAASLRLPEMQVDGARTRRWLALSGAMVNQAGAAGVGVTGDFAVVAPGFPPLRGHLAPLADGGGTAMLAMPDWAAATTRLAVPVLAARWTRSGGVEFGGRALVTGPVPGGRVSDLAIPLVGSWSAGGGLQLGYRCTPVRFDRLTLGALDLRPAAGKALTLCPAGASRAMVTLGAGGTRLSLRTAGLDLAGRINGSPLTIATGAVALAWPGGLTAETIAGVLAPAASRGISSIASQPAAQLRLARVTARLGPVIAGQFSGGEVGLAAMPGAVRAASGAFRWQAGRLTVDQAQFRIEDPALHPAFAPIIAHDVTLEMANGRITGAAGLRATAANRELAGVTIVHDLAGSTGHAEVDMPGLVFDRALQPRQLSPLAEGVIADAKGTLTGHSSFVWDRGRLTSSGSLATTGFDFAAAFGPVKGVSGQVAFTDLLGLVTAPDQRLAIAAINPGIEVDDGILTFALQPGQVLVVKGAEWPFLDGRLTLLPTRLALGATEQRRYELRVDGLNAAKFLARMDLANLAATGTFDGNLPLVFDDSGGRIEKGLLLSRPPGGTVSYVGALTYKDLSPMANYAFQALRALRYRQMRIAMDGALAGDIVTRVSMQGVGQGAGAKRNFITNQIARLPIRFDVTVTAPFMQLVTSFRSFYDSAMVADPRTLGLIDAQGRPIAHPAADRQPAAKKPPAIQP